MTLTLDDMIEATVRMEGLDGPGDLTWPDHPALKMGMYQREQDRGMVEPFNVMPDDWDGHRRLKEDAYPVYRPGQDVSFGHCAKMGERAVPPWLIEEWTASVDAEGREKVVA